MPDADPRPDPAADERRARLRRRVRPILLIVGVVLTALNMWVCVGREKDKERASEREGLQNYLVTSYSQLHKQTESVLSGLAGLVDETAPSAKGAVGILDDEIVPSLDWVIEEGRVLVPAGEAARALHSEYLATLAATRGDAAKLRAIFAEPAGEIGEQRRRAAAVLIGTRTRFEGFYAHVVEAGQRTGLVITPKLDAGVPGAAPAGSGAAPAPSPSPDAAGAAPTSAPGAPAPAPGAGGMAPTPGAPAPASGAAGVAPAPGTVAPAPGAAGTRPAPAPGAPAPAPGAAGVAPAPGAPAPAAGGRVAPAPGAPAPAPVAGGRVAPAPPPGKFDAGAAAPLRP